MAVGALTALAAALRFIGIAHQSYWYDEADTVWLVHQSMGHMLAYLHVGETTPPLYFIVAWLWGHVFGYGEASLRSLSALAGVLTVPIAYQIGAVLFSRRTAVIAAALTACSPLLVWYSQEARSYALLVLFTSVALLAFAHLRVGVTRRWTLIWVGAAGLAVATHYYAVLVIVPEAIWLLWRYRQRRMVRLAVEGVVLWFSALAVLAFRQLQALQSTGNWITKVPLGQRLEDLAKTFVIGPEAPAGVWLALGCGIAVAASAWLATRSGDRHEQRQILFVARLAASGLAIVAVLVLLGSDQLWYRNLIALWLPVALTVAAGLGVRRFRAAGTTGAVALCLVGISVVIGVAVDTGLQRPAWRSVARALGSRPDRAIFAVNGCQLLPLSLYVPGLRLAPKGGAVAREIDVIAVGDQANWHTVFGSGWYVTCLRQAHAVRVPDQLAGFRQVGRPVRINQFSVYRLHSSSPVRVTRKTFSAAGLRGALMVTAQGGGLPRAGYVRP